MKNIITIFISLILTSIGFSQEKRFQKTYKAGEKIIMNGGDTAIYIKDENINKFVGTWEWKQGNDILRLNLEKMKKNSGTDDKPFEIDLITGNYEYISNEKIISSSKTITGSSQGKQSILFIIVYDSISKTNTELQLVMLSNGSIKLEPSTRPRERKPDNSLLIPRNIVLNKVIATTT